MVQGHGLWRVAGQQLACFLRTRLLSQGQLARALGVVPSLVTHWVNGHKRPTVSRLLKLLALLKRSGVVSQPEEVFDWVKWWEYDRAQLTHALEARIDEGDREAKSLAEWLAQARPAWRADPVAQMIALPGHYVLREALLHEWRTRLTDESDYRTPAVKHLVLWGTAGVGKTVLAQALTLDPEVNEYFRNGVLWATLGPERTRGEKKQSNSGDVVQAVGLARRTRRDSGNAARAHQGQAERPGSASPDRAGRCMVG